MPHLSAEELAAIFNQNPDLAERNQPSRKTGQLPVPPVSLPAPEKDFQARLIKELQGNGWLVHAERPAMSKSGNYSTPIQGDKGFFDIIAIHLELGKILLIECKSGGGKLSKFQEQWFLAASKCRGVITLVVRPEDWEEILTIIQE